MAHFHFRNVNDSFRKMVNLFADESMQTSYENEPTKVLISRTDTRNGPVLQIMEPVILTFEKPCERVLFNQARDCNPFFHLFESLYMLSGGNKIAPLVYYAAQISNYSDDAETQNGAYGYRWRHARAINVESDLGLIAMDFSTHDQLKILIQHLKNEPNSRRAVLQMWNVEDDLLKIDPPNKSKDVCCNLCVMFSIREEGLTIDRFLAADQVGSEGSAAIMSPPPAEKFLDMTVINRSNDLVWGMLGANYVHFSFLQEYVAANLGVEVGVYNQMSNNLHIYTENNSGFKHEEWLADEMPDCYLKGIDTTTESNKLYRTANPLRLVPLIRDPATFEDELPKFIHNACNHDFLAIYTEPFLNCVATPLLWAFELHKKREYDLALNALKACNADDWRIAGHNWIMKRKLNWEAKQQGEVNGVSSSTQQS